MAARLQTIFNRLSGRTTPDEETPRNLPEGTPPALQGVPGLEWAWTADLRTRGAGGSLAPASGSVVLPKVKLFHDGRAGEVTLPVARAGGFDLALSGFSGSFLSLVFDLPAEAVQGLRARHLIRLDTSLSGSEGLRAYARLNIRHGPNTEQITREVTAPAGVARVAEFDMFYVGLNEKRVEAAWIDLIFNPVADERIAITDLTVSRRPRAAL
ncbi:DUF6478 family protein [Falsigemmobacter faecalis]|uniref:Uncharacterized protein n=1 Tax=Falsigemmobacter faecalis TaxID=2488730 RepID=A0A3P3DRL8_9RHOB|nr:DUF6478 family protein [Falsigemmobacter faecalis]RRH76845.1 hypothetical protein EG244_04340 [Falsigemmobacter faecalis]